MVDRRSQGNPAIASAVGSGFIAGTDVCFAAVVDAGFERTRSPADLAGDSRQTGTGPTESRETPDPRRNPEIASRSARPAGRDADRRVLLSPRPEMAPAETGQAPSLHINGRQEARLLPSLGQLLERISDLEQRRLAPGASEKRDANWQSPQKSGRHVDVGIPGDGRSAGAASGGVIAIDQVGEPGGASRGSDERVQFELVHDKVDAFGATELVIQGQRINILFRAERTLLLRLEKSVLPEIRHLPVAVVLVEVNHILQTLHRSAT